MTATYSAKLKPNELEPRKIASSINRIIEGRTDNYGSVTLTANTTTTTVTCTTPSRASGTGCWCRWRPGRR